MVVVVVKIMKLLRSSIGTEAEFSSLRRRRLLAEDGRCARDADWTRCDSTSVGELSCDEGGNAEEEDLLDAGGLESDRDLGHSYESLENKRSS